jgi:hypothetical protein
MHATLLSIFVATESYKERETGSRTEIYIRAWALDTSLYLPLAVASTLSPAFLASSAALFYLRQLVLRGKKKNVPWLRERSCRSHLRLV